MMAQLLGEWSDVARQQMGEPLHLDRRSTDLVAFSPSRTTVSGASAPILVVEDDPHLRQIIRDVLEDEGLVIETAADGRQALQRAATQRPALVVLDMTLPVLDGAGVVVGLRAAFGVPPRSC
jgi:PleD family two-component response regulator